MKTPQLWVTIDKRGFSKEGLKKLLEYNIAGTLIPQHYYKIFFLST